jgi:hypothetical protein
MLIKYFLGIWNKSVGKKYLLADLEVIGERVAPPGSSILHESKILGEERGIYADSLFWSSSPRR